MFENPRRRRRRLPPRGAGGHFMRRGSNRRRRRARRNPGELAVVGLNPRRRRPRRRSYRRRRYGRRNPVRLFRGGYFRRITRQLPNVAWAFEGYTAATMLPAYLERMPTIGPLIAKTGRFPFVNYLVKAGVALVNGAVVRNFAGTERGNAAELGGLLAVGSEVARDYIFPMLGVGAYLEGGMGAYLEGGVGQYPSPGMMLPEYDTEGAVLPLPPRLNAGNRLPV